MKKFRTVASVIIMVIAGIVGFFIGAFLNEPMAGTILFSMIAGIACIVYAIDNHEEQGKFQFIGMIQQLFLHGKKKKIPKKYLWNGKLNKTGRNIYNKIEKTGQNITNHIEKTGQKRYC